MDRIFQINWFDWGESDDIIKWPTNSFYSWENIEVRKNLSALQLSPALIDTEWVFDDDILYMVNLETLWVSNWWIVVCLENGKIFLNWVLKTTLNTWTNAHNRIYWIWVNENLLWEQYVYYISWTSFWSWKIHRSTTTLSAFDVSYREYTITSWWSEFVWTINDVWFLYIATWNKVFLLESDEIVQDFLILPSQEIIMWFTQFQWTYKIYTNSINTWIQYIWDWVSEAISYRQEWINQPVLWVVNDWAYDYAILWFSQFYSDLYLISWTQKSELRVNLETASYSRLLNWNMSIREWIIYISWWQSWESSNYWIYTYWNYYPWTAKSLVQSYSLANDWFMHHTHSDTESYFACDDNKVYKISHNNPPSVYASTWYVVTHLYQSFLWEEKSFNYMKIWFKLNWWEIKIYARTSMDLISGTDWILIKTITNDEYWSKKFCRLDKNELNNNWKILWTFNELQLKFVLTPSADLTKTPELYQPTTWLTITNDK